MARTLEGLHARGHAVTVIAPTSGESHVTEPSRGDWLRTIFVPVRPRPLVPSVARALMRRHPGSMMRHDHPAVAGVVWDLLPRENFDIVHVEQLHALPHAAAAFARGVPVVLRAENVESDLWHQSAASRPWWRFPAEWEARKLARWEGEALGRVAVTVAVTRKDADRLRRLSPASRIEVVRAPMPAELSIGDRALNGAPPIVLLSSDWFPNRDGATWFLRHIWPAVFASIPRGFFFPPGPAGGARPPPRGWCCFFLFSFLVFFLRFASGPVRWFVLGWARGGGVVAPRPPRPPPRFPGGGRPLERRGVFPRGFPPLVWAARPPFGRQPRGPAGLRKTHPPAGGNREKGARRLAARGESLAAFDGRCILAGCVAPPSNIPDILGRRALPARRLARLGATPDFHHGLLGPKKKKF